MLCADPEWEHVGVITADIRRDWVFFDTRISLERLDIFDEMYPDAPTTLGLGRINVAELELLVYPAGRRAFPRAAVYSKKGQCLVFTHSPYCLRNPTHCSAQQFRSVFYNYTGIVYPSGRTTLPSAAACMSLGWCLVFKWSLCFLIANALPCTAAHTEKGLHLAFTQSLLAVSAGV